MTKATAESNTGPDPLLVAARRYYFKPMAVFFNALHLRAFRTAGMRWRSPVLDIGCSDGAYGLLLAELLGAPDRLIGVDIDAAAIAAAGDEARKLYDEMTVASATALPFADETFASVVVNASLTSIQPGLTEAMREAHRVLRSGGSFYATVCTDQYEQQYWITRVLRRAGLHGLARRYMNAMNRRMQQAHLYAPDQWTALFEGAGFEIVHHFGFMPLRLVPLWSFLAWTPLRLHGAVKLFPCASLHRGLASLYRWLFGGVYERTPAELEPGRSGYIFIEAVKK